MAHCIRDGKIYKNVNEDTVKCREIQVLEICENVEENKKCIESASVNSLCIHNGKMYINLESGCKKMNDLETCESTTSDDKCSVNAVDDDICRFENAVYQTKNNSCQIVTTLIDEISNIPLYFDSHAYLTTTDNTNSVDSMYMCKNKYGELSCEKSVQDIGGLIFKRTNAQKDIHICINGNSDEATNSYALTSLKGYQTLNTKTVDAFPGATRPGNIVINFDKNKALLVRDQEFLPECDIVPSRSSCKSYWIDVDQCIMGDVLLYLSGKRTCTKQTGPANNYDFTYFNTSSEIIDPMDVKPTTEVAYVYKCEYDSNGFSERCYMVRGYIIVNDFILNCNGWSSCSFIGMNKLDTTCQYAKEGEIMGNGKAICMDNAENTVNLPTDTNDSTRYIMYKTGETSVLYGQIKDTVVVLALTKDSVTVVPFGKGITRGYHQNQKTFGKVDLIDALIYCSEEGVLESCEVVIGRNGYYLNGDDDASEVEIIKCEENKGCHKQSVDKTSCTESGTIIKSGTKIQLCKKEGKGFTKIDISQNNLSVTYDYIPEIDGSFPGTIEENKPFVKIGMDGSVILMDNGIYLNERVHGEIYNALFDCTTLNVNTICNSTDALFGYYRNSGTIRLDDAFISCSENGCEYMSVDKNKVCSVNSVGQLIGSTDAPTLCLDYDKDMDEDVKVNLDNSSVESYMIGYCANNIYGIKEGNYAYVNITQNYVKFRSTGISFISEKNKNKNN